MLLNILRYFFIGFVFKAIFFDVIYKEVEKSNYLFKKTGMIILGIGIGYFLL